MSLDGRSVYALSAHQIEDGSIATLFRNSAGTFANGGCITDDDFSDDDCGGEEHGLGGARDVAVSPDGASVYVAADSDDAVVNFDRSVNGTLDWAGCVDDNDFATDPNQGPDACAQSADGLNGASGVAISPDGETVYATSRDDDALVILDREPDDGSLTPLGCWDDNDTGADAGCGHTTNGLDGPEDVAVSPDGESVYVASRGDDAVVHLHRDDSTGLLTAAECYDDNDFGVDPDQGPDTCLLAGATNGLNGANSVVVSPDGNSVYATSELDQAIVRFDRGADGLLTPIGCHQDNDSGADCSASTNGLGRPESVAIAPDGRSVHVASLPDNAIVTFYRGASGAISPGPCVEDEDNGPDSCTAEAHGLFNATGVAVAPDGKQVFASAGPWMTYLGREDADAPETTITAGPPEGSVVQTATTAFSFASSEPLSTFECSFNGAAFAPCSSPITVGPFNPGTQTFRVAATDPSDNTDATPASRSFLVPDPPEPPPDPPPDPGPGTPPPPPPPAPVADTPPAETTTPKKCKRKRKGTKRSAASAKKKKCKRKKRGGQR